MAEDAPPPFPLAFLFCPHGQLRPMFAPSGDTGASQSCVGSLDGVRSTEFARLNPTSMLVSLNFDQSRQTNL
jgi:hypothetical protein